MFGGSVMIDFILYALPWWWPLVIAIPAGLLAARYFGVNAAILVGVLAMAATIYAKGRKAGASVEVAKQQQADTKARDVIHEKKEDVRSIPSTPAGKAERDRRFDRW